MRYLLYVSPVAAAPTGGGSQCSQKYSPPRRCRPSWGGALSGPPPAMTATNTADATSSSTSTTVSARSQSTAEAMDERLITRCARRLAARGGSHCDEPVAASERNEMPPEDRDRGTPIRRARARSRAARSEDRMSHSTKHGCQRP